MEHFDNRERNTGPSFWRVGCRGIAGLWLFCLGSWLVAGQVEVSDQASNSGTFGLRVSLTDSQPAYVRDNTPFAESRYRMRLYFRIDGLVLTEGAGIDFFSANDSVDLPQIRLSFERTGGQTHLSVSVREDGGAMVGLPNAVPLSPGYHALEIDWQRGPGTGTLDLWFDGAHLQGLSGLDNDTTQVEYVMLGAIAGMGVGASGHFDIDDFASQRVCFVGLLGCNAGCQFLGSQAGWPEIASVSELVYFLNDPCFEE